MQERTPKMRKLTVELTEQSIVAIVDRDGLSFADSGELMRGKTADCR
jgi:hypothetical protein